ncbi:MAG: hypothetical protein M0R77_07940 [Gammaproteobacteria bacterium]|nr:hypothetical protein [Gammaproteobacteria bacterium]
MKYFTGVGSRETPEHICGIVKQISLKLSEDNWILRSGGADGADLAFQGGTTEDITPEIYLPWYGFNNLYSTESLLFPKFWDNWHEAEALASEVHPAWDKLSDGAKALHTRNCYQVLGKDLETPSKFLICWAKETKSGEISGGTRTAVVLAQQNNIPIYNLWYDEVQSRFQRYLEG